MESHIANAYSYLKEDVEQEKESYIKHIRLDLSHYSTYCPADALAKAIGGEFTEEFVKEVYQDGEWPIKNFERQGRCYIEIATFLEKLKAGLTFSDSPV